MQTEFTCGIYTAEMYGNEWGVHANGSTVSVISLDGERIRFLFQNLYIPEQTIYEMLVLMGNIKRQYKQLQTTS